VDLSANESHLPPRVGGFCDGENVGAQPWNIAHFLNGGRFIFAIDDRPDMVVSTSENCGAFGIVKKSFSWSLWLNMYLVALESAKKSAVLLVSKWGVVDIRLKSWSLIDVSLLDKLTTFLLLPYLILLMYSTVLGRLDRVVVGCCTR
jgi:hypothetical protein